MAGHVPIYVSGNHMKSYAAYIHEVEESSNFFFNPKFSQDNVGNRETQVSHGK